MPLHGRLAVAWRYLILLGHLCRRTAGVSARGAVALQSGLGFDAAIEEDEAKHREEIGGSSEHITRLPA
jgi:hypothetical protein